MLQKNNKKPSFNLLYVLKFPRYYTTWRLTRITEDGYYIFLTSGGREVPKLSQNRFNFLCHYYLVDTVDFTALNLTTAKGEKIKISIEKATAFTSKEYNQDELESLVDDIEDVEF